MPPGSPYCPSCFHSLPRPLPGLPFPAQVGFFCHPNSFSLQVQSSPSRWPWGSSGACESQGDHVTQAGPTSLPCCRLKESLLVSGGRVEVCRQEWTL